MIYGSKKRVQVVRVHSVHAGIVRVHSRGTLLDRLYAIVRIAQQQHGAEKLERDRAVRMPPYIFRVIIAEEYIKETSKPTSTLKFSAAKYFYTKQF